MTTLVHLGQLAPPGRRNAGHQEPDQIRRDMQRKRRAWRVRNAPSPLTKYEETLRASLAAIVRSDGSMTWQELTDFAKIWLESLGTAIENGWARPSPTAASSQIAAFRVFYQHSTQHFNRITTRARAISEAIRTAPEVTQEDAERWRSEIRELEEEHKRLPRALQNHVVDLLLSLARTIDEGVKALKKEEMALWKQALIGVGMVMDKVGKEAAENTKALREVVVQVPEIVKKGLSTATIGLIAAGVIGAVIVVPSVLRSKRAERGESGQ
jgi:hypothetical protein